MRDQALHQVLVSLPAKLNLRWCKYIADNYYHSKKRYSYCVSTAVLEAGSTRQEFLACWQSYRSAAKRKGGKHFHEDVFQRFCAAGFGREADDSSERRLEFVRRILAEDGEPETVQVQSMLVRDAYFYVRIWLYTIV